MTTCKQGWLQKCGDDVFKTWRRRYFVLFPEGLSYFINENMQELKGTIHLSRKSENLAPAEASGKEFAFCVYALGGNRKYIMCANSAAERDSWVQALSSGTAKAEVTYVKQGELIKQGAIRKNWKSRYFRLTPHSLMYFKKETDTKPAGNIPLIVGASVTMEHDHPKGFVFSIKPHKVHTEDDLEETDTQRQFHLLAPTHLEMTNWVRTIQNVLENNTNQLDYLAANQMSPRHQNQDKRAPDVLYTYTHTRQQAGWLKKQGGVLKNWKKRYFVLSGGLLSYFTEESQATQQALSIGVYPTGNIAIAGAEISFEEGSKSPFKFQIKAQTTKRIYVIACETKQERKLWVTTLIKHARTVEDLDVHGRPSHLLASLELNSDDEDEELSATASTASSLGVSCSKSSTMDRISVSDCSVTKPAKKSLKLKKGQFPKREPLERKDYTSPESAREGWIMKLRKGMHYAADFHERYFILKGSTLIYYKTRPAYQGDDRNKKREFDLKGFRIDLLPKPYYLAITNVAKLSDITMLNFDSSQERNLWLIDFNEAVTPAGGHGKTAQGINVVREGFLSLLSKQTGEWERLYLVLDTKQNISAFMSQHKAGMPSQTISIFEKEVNMVPEDEYDRDCCFAIGIEGDESHWVMAADTQEVMDDWFDTILDTDFDALDQEMQEKMIEERNLQERKPNPLSSASAGGYQAPGDAEDSDEADFAAEMV